MQSFVRATVLSDVGGRGNYISDPAKQEEIVVASERIDWKPYHDFEQSRPRQGEKIAEGRELVIDIPNEWYYTLSREELARRVRRIVEKALGKTTDLQWAVHWNSARTNLHIHVIFSERTREDKGTWDRDVYLTSEGKVARKAADRARDSEGNVLPPVHRKGEAKGEFGAKNPDYARRWWLASAKTNIENVLKEYGVIIDERGFVSQFHEGKGSDAPRIRRKNEAIRATNANYKTFSEENPGIDKKDIKKAHRKAVSAAKEGKVSAFERTVFGGVKVLTFTLKEWEKRQAKEAKRQKKIEARAERAVERAKTAQIRPNKGEGDKKTVNATKPLKKPSRTEIKAEQARLAEEQRAAALAAFQAEQAAKNEVAAIAEQRWATAVRLGFHGWRSYSGEQALEAMRQDRSAFPIVYRSEYGFSTRTFKGEEWREARAFADRTAPFYNQWCERIGGKEATMNSYQSRVLDERIEEAEEQRHTEMREKRNARPHDKERS